MLILLADLVMFIVEVSIGLYKQGDLLEVNADTLLKLGANQYEKVKAGEVWRLISAMFLHINFLHFFGNFITTLIFLTRIEYSLGWLRTLIIYILSGIGGNIFSDVTQPDSNAIKAGASTALFGIIGIILGYVIINWRGLSVIGSLLKCQLVCICMVIIMFIFIFTPGATNNIDYLGHLGGFLTGLWLISINPTILDEKS
jgi:rhomboid protease GluP